MRERRMHNYFLYWFTQLWSYI